MIKLRQTVIVEGRYDKARLAGLIDANILTTEGFLIFRDKEKLKLIQKLAAQDGIVILTDSDAAGFRIRSHIAGAVDAAQVTHVYIPDLFGKERRKPKPGAEGKLGVEGVSGEILRQAFEKAGLCLPPTETDALPVPLITRADLAEWGLAGGENSAAFRQRLLQRMGLPTRMNAKAMLAVVNRLYTREAFLRLLEEESL